MMRRFVHILLAAYLCTIVAVAALFAADQMQRGDTVGHALAIAPAYAFYAALAAPIFIIPSACAAALLHKGLARLMKGASPHLLRFCFTLLCTLLGGSVMALSVRALVPIGAVAGAVGGYFADSPPGRRDWWVVVIGLGLIVGSIYLAPDWVK